VATKRQKAKRRGDQGEEWLAARLADLWPSVRRRRRYDWGKGQSDVVDEATPFTWEAKKRGGPAPWPAMLEKALEQASGYASERVDGSWPVVALLNSPGAGHRQEARVYMDFDCFMEFLMTYVGLEALAHTQQELIAEYQEALKQGQQPKEH